MSAEAEVEMSLQDSAMPEVPASGSTMTVSKPKVTSLLSNWFSGATLLTILLSNHSDIVSNGEAMYFDEKDSNRYDCSCGKYIEECEFYEAAAKHMRVTNGTGWDRQVFVQAPSFSQNTILRHFLRSSRYESVLRDRVIGLVGAYRTVRNRFLDAQLRFVDNAMRISGASMYLDGTKSIRRAQLLARSDRCEMKVLHMVRDGRGFSLSYVNAMTAARQTENASVTSAAKAWTRYIAWVDEFSRDFPAIPVLTVRYEDLCRSTAETIRSICAFLELPYEDVTMGTMKGIHILGNSMRRKFNGEIVEDTAWRYAFDQRTQSVMTLMMRRELERFGYV